MKYILLPIFLLLFSTYTLATDKRGELSPLFYNEGESRYLNELSRSDLDYFNKTEKNLDQLDLLVTQNKKNFCAYQIINSAKNLLNDHNNVDIFLLYLREKKLVDDVSLQILTKAKSNTLINLKIPPDESLTEENISDAFLRLTEVQSKRVQNLECQEDLYRDLYFSLRQKAPILTRQLKNVLKLALKKHVIDQETYNVLDRMRKNRVQEWPMTLSEYARKISYIKKNLSDDENEKNNFFVTEGPNKQISYRQYLYSQYSESQILLMGQLTLNLKKRLSAESISINIHYSDREDEVILLSPMEQFRIILKILRKEMSDLGQSDLMGGKKVSYLDIITASYELGHISGEEIKSLVALEEIWNPKRTKKEKAMFWIKTFGSFSAVLLPPPYGFLSVLAIMIIDQQLSDPKRTEDPDFNII